MVIIKANKQKSWEIAALHKEHIESGFLSMLGVRFLKLLYVSIMESNSAFCLMAVENGEVAGFISGAVKVNALYKEFIRKNFLPAGCIIAGKLFRPSVLRHVVETMLYTKKSNGNLPEAELLSVVIGENYRRKGVGARLFQSLVEEFRARGVSEFKVVVGAQLEPAKCFYKRMGGAPIGEIELHRGEKSEVYSWKLGAA
jgi:GNAT superfamily N-acetyltransferase